MRDIGDKRGKKKKIHTQDSTREAEPVGVKCMCILQGISYTIRRVITKGQNL